MNPLTSSSRLARGLFDINAQVLRSMLQIAGNEFRDGVAISQSYFEQLPQVRGLGQLVSLQRETGNRVLADTRRHLQERGDVLMRAAEDTGTLLTEVLYGGTPARADATDKPSDAARTAGRPGGKAASTASASSTKAGAKAKDKPAKKGGKTRTGKAGSKAKTSTAGSQAAQPVVSSQESANDADMPLTEINGVGPTLAGRLQAAGVATLLDVANLDPTALEAEDHPLHDLKGRMVADRWIAQARRLVGAGKVVNL